MEGHYERLNETNDFVAYYRITYLRISMKGMRKRFFFCIDRLQTEVRTWNVINTKLEIQRPNRRIWPTPFEFCEVNRTLQPLRSTCNISVIYCGILNCCMCNLQFTVDMLSKNRIYDAPSHMTDARSTIQKESENLKVNVACRAGDWKLGTYF